jgi:hypothetical protein
MARQALFFPAPGGGPIYGRLREQDAGVGRWVIARRTLTGRAGEAWASSEPKSGALVLG